MTWKIRVEHIDDKTGESITTQSMITDEAVKHSNLDALDLAFQKMTDELMSQLSGDKK